MFDINTKEIQGIITNRDSRIEVARQSHTWFFHVYLSHYITYPTADFQKSLSGIGDPRWEISRQWQ